MHRITAGLLRDFVSSFELNEMNEHEQFERLVNHCIITPEVVEGYDLADVTSSDTDDGIDGCAVIVDEEVIVSKEDCETILSDGRRNHSVKLVLLQAKSSEQIELGELLKYHSAIERFCQDFNSIPADPIEANTKEIYAAAIDKAGCIKDGKPELLLRYVYTGRYLKPSEIERAKNELLSKLHEGGYFSQIDYEILDREGVGRAFNMTTAPIEAKINAFSIAALPPIADIEEAYLAVVPAKQFVERMLSDDEGRLRVHAFEENVRAFLGADNPVNSAIGNTLQDEATNSRFPVLNNGITVISPDVRVQGLSITFVDYQVVNGCQTSNMLWLNKEYLNENLMVAIKVIETENEDVFSDLVKATNSQTKIDDDQFLSLQPVARRIEVFFNSYTEDENRLYFERRDRQYVGQEVPGVKVFDLKLLARCIAACFLQRPDLAFRYPRKIFSDPTISSLAFSPDNREIIYYTACLLYYRVAILFSNKALSPEARRYKWHIIALFVLKAARETIPSLRSTKIESFCDSICKMILNNPTQCKETLVSCYEQIKRLGDLTDDRLKRQAVYEEILKF
ncbi:MAG: AIPR family protein [Smithellaceae bacterium]